MCATEASLLERCRAGDDQAFEELYRKYSSRVYSLAVRFVGSRSEAEDLPRFVALDIVRLLCGIRPGVGRAVVLHGTSWDGPRPTDSHRTRGRGPHIPSCS